jgi:acetolactate synthase-1/2/3 large subunit
MRLEDARNGAELFLLSLGSLGVKYVFFNSGTDYIPVIEAAARLAETGARIPEFVTAPHEMLAVSMAHGHAMVTGKPQVVLVHTLPGTANSVCGVMNASRAMVPLILVAGRTPVTEEELPGHRDLVVHWGQESRDQASILREFVKWDYEIRWVYQIPQALARAYRIEAWSLDSWTK